MPSRMQGQGSGAGYPSPRWSKTLVVKDSLQDNGEVTFEVNECPGASGWMFSGMCYFYPSLSLCVPQINKSYLF